MGRMWSVKGYVNLAQYVICKNSVRNCSDVEYYGVVVRIELVGQRISLFPETYRPKLRSKVPSMKAINTYNSILTENLNTYDNLLYTPDEISLEYKPPLTPASISNVYEYGGTLSASSTLDNSEFGNTLDNRGIIKPNNEAYDYPSLQSSSSIAGDNHSELENKEQGSTSKLISSKTSGSCRSCFIYAETVLCTISLAAGLGNLYRLPQTTLIRGGLPFLVAYIILSLFIGLPLLFLELGLGQLAQEGFIKIWRAVPLFRGLAYVKFGAIALLSLYYSLYIGLFLYYLIWVGRSSLPFGECATVKITECDWKNKSVRKIFNYICTSCDGCLTALTVKAVEVEDKFKNLEQFVTVDWSLLSSANVWYYAVIQVFFSTTIGFGPFVTNAGTILSKVNAFWVAVGYTAVNLFFGIASVILCVILSGKIPTDTTTTGQIAELHLVSLIYDSGSDIGGKEAQIWAIIVFCMLVLSGLISMITLIYTVLKALRVETKQRWPWWQVTLIVVFVGFVLSALILLPSKYAAVHLLDHYVVGNAVLLCTVFEVLAVVAFYGSKRIQLDFEFVLGKSLSKIWIFFWWIIPPILSGLFIWALCTLPLTKIWDKDPVWLYVTGWTLVFASLVVIFALGCYQVQKQDEYYTFNDKLVAVTKPLRNWGPVDPIMRYTWVQWHSKAKNGERDFTLKRRGTKDYTHSVKKRREPYGKTYISTISNASTLSRQSPESYRNDLNQNSIKRNFDEPLSVSVSNPYNKQTTKIIVNNDKEFNGALQVTSLISSNLNSPMIENVYVNNHNFYPTYKTKVNVNQSSVNPNGEMPNESSTSDGYGTFRKGPYFVPHDNNEHICHRKYNDHELSTEL
ncbi:hypothetical protein FQR65_LT00300 [Abscondita terminalis]|nr:hypothetical protein FQR65_LT00300 [Abscondita terminalis]